MSIVNRMNLGRHPVEVWLEREVKRGRNKSNSRKYWRGVWDKESKEEFGRK